MRKDERTTCIHDARIVLATGSSISCRIANISGGGAQLLLDNAQQLPSHFGLNDVGAATVHPVSLVWISKRRAGVKFLDNFPSATGVSVRLFATA